MTEVREGAERYAHLSSKRSAAALRGLFWSLVNSMVPSALAAAVFLFSSRILHPADFGLVALALSISSLIGALAPIGFGEALIQRRSVDEAHLTTVFWTCMLAGFAAFGLTCLASVPIARYMEQPILVPLMWLTGLKTVIDMTAVVPSALLARKMSFHLVALRTAIAAVASGSVCVVLLLLDFGLWALALSQVAASVAGSAGAIATAGWRPRGRPSLAAFRDLRRYGLFTSATSFMQFIYPEQLLVGSLLGPTALGIYGFGRRIFQILNDLVAGALASVSHALLSSLQDERDKLREVFLLASYASATAAFAVFGGLAAIAPDGVPVVFGPQWEPAVPVVQLFCILGLITSIGYVQAAMVKAQGHADWWFWYQTVKRVVLTLSVFAFFPYGVTAVTAATVLASVLLFSAPVAKSARLIDLRLSAYVHQFVAPLIASAAMGAAVWTFRDYQAETNQIARLAASIALGVVVYCSVLAALSHRRLNEMVAFVRRRARR